MRILLTNVELSSRAGTQSWVRTMYAALSLKHKVDVYSHHGDVPADEFNQFDPEADYDLALINHVSCFRDLRGARIRTRVFTAHGTVPSEEWAPPGADYYVAVSEKVANQVPYSCKVIFNPIDTQHFRPLSSPHPDPKDVLFLSNKQGRARGVLEAACEEAGMTLTVIGKESFVDDPLDVINNADVVVGVGRCALEALACGRRVLNYDWKGYRGLITPQNFEFFRRDNFAAVADATWPTPSEVAAVLKSATPLSLRERVTLEHSPAAVAKQYIELADPRSALIRRTIGTVVRRGPWFLSSPRLTVAWSEMRRGRPDRAVNGLVGVARPPAETDPQWSMRSVEMN